MPEQFGIRELENKSVVAYNMFLKAVTIYFRKKHNSTVTKEFAKGIDRKGTIEILLKINELEFSFIDIIEAMSEVRQDTITEQAKKLLEEKARSLQDILYYLEENIKEAAGKVFSEIKNKREFNFTIVNKDGKMTKHLGFVSLAFGNDKDRYSKVIEKIAVDFYHSEMDEQSENIINVEEEGKLVLNVSDKGSVSFIK